jgi:type IV pilus assembly protein PilB
MRMQKTLGQILLDAGLINETQLNNGLTNQKQWGGRLGSHLVRTGYLTESQLLDALSYQLGVAKINFRKSHIYREALALVPKPICEKYNLIPVAVKQKSGTKKLLLAMSDPTNYKAIQEVEFTSGHTVVTVVALESEIERAIAYCYSIDGLRESRGLSEVSSVIEIDNSRTSEEEQPVIITPEGELHGLDNRNSDLAVRVLVDLLADNGLIELEEFRRRLDEYKRKR